MRQLLASWNPTRDIWEDGQPDLFSERSGVYSETLPASGMTRRGQLFMLPTLERPTSGPESSLLLTPTANLGSNGGSQPPEKRREGGHGPTLADVIAPRTLIPTPTASDWKGGYHQEGKGMSLSQATKLLPTPVAQAPGNTAEAHLRKKPGRTQVTDLGIIAREGLFTTGWNLLPTPQATNATYSSNGYGANLHETAGTLRDSFGPYAPAVARWETITGRTAPAPTEPPLREGGKPRLSVRFVEWLMGLPDGHVTGVGLSREKTLRALGNGVVPLQAAEGILRCLQQERQVALEEGWPEYNSTNNH